MQPSIGNIQGVELKLLSTLCMVNELQVHGRLTLQFLSIKQQFKEVGLHFLYLLCEAHGFSS